MTKRQPGVQELSLLALVGVFVLTLALTAWGDEIHLVNGEVYTGWIHI